MDESQVAFDQDKELEAINGVFDLFAEMKLTVAEAVHVVAVLNESMKAKYPKEYEIMTKDW